eukprot:UN08757
MFHSYFSLIFFQRIYSQVNLSSLKVPIIKSHFTGPLLVHIVMS